MPLAHEKLVAWRRADDLFIAVHRLVRTFPTDERWELCAQMRRAAFSVPANIVEGTARRSGRDRLRFLNIAEASLAEVGYCLHVSKRLEYIDEQTYASFQQALVQYRVVLNGAFRDLGAPDRLNA